MGHKMKLIPVLQIVGKTTKEINYFFENWHDHTELNRLETIRALRSLGHLSAKYKNETNNEFKCPLHGFNLIKPCSLHSCQYHIPTVINNPVQIQMANNCKNCLINCLDISKNNRLSANETANLLGVSVSEVNNNNASAISKIRKSKIKESLERFQIPRFEYLSGHCVACEQYIQDEIEMCLCPELIIQPSVHGWCSIECKEKKPKWQFNIEKEFNCNYLHALTVGFVLYKNIESLGGIFGLNKEIVLKLKSQILRNLDFLSKNFSLR